MIHSQKVFHLLNGREGNKIVDVCLLLELVRFGAHHLFNFGHWTRELFRLCPARRCASLIPDGRPRLALPLDY